MLLLCCNLQVDWPRTAHACVQTYRTCSSVSEQVTDHFSVLQH